MCGRYTLTTLKADLDAYLGVEMPDPPPRYNVAPSQPVPAITADAVKLLRWGFAPPWSKEPTIKFSNINARRETVATSNAYRGSFRRKRCLLPADGFYEWAAGKPKVPPTSGSRTAARSRSRGSGTRGAPTASWRRAR